MPTEPDASVDADFERIALGRTTVWVRRGYAAHLSRLGIEGGAPAAVGWIGGGRAAHPIVELPGGERVVVRSFRRGGALRHLNAARYFRGDRARDELLVTEVARKAGVRVPLVIAASRHREVVGYTAKLATRLIPHGRPIRELLRGDPSSPEARSLLAAAGAEIRRLHDAGVAHPDLTVDNLLVGASEPSERPIYILDLDRARRYRGPVPARRRRRDLLRLRRSARKTGIGAADAAWRTMVEGYDRFSAAADEVE